MGTRIITCSSCGTVNKNSDYCTFCNALISDAKKREIKAKKVKQVEIDKEVYKLENPNLAKRLKKHPFFLFRFFGWILYSTIMIVSAIGAAIAWFIAMVAAG